MSDNVFLVLLGDSDISRWPDELLPVINDLEGAIVNHSRSGALLQDMQKQAKAAIYELNGQRDAQNPQAIIILACAGENDVSSCISLDTIIQAFEDFVRIMVTEPIRDNMAKRHIVFLGPKLEPWLKDDTYSQKSYFKLSKSLDGACKRLQSSICDDLNSRSDMDEQKFILTFVDCLTQFCGETADIPGAVVGGHAIPQAQYFHDDGLHLSRSGYEIWKEMIEKKLSVD